MPKSARLKVFHWGCLRVRGADSLGPEPSDSTFTAAYLRGICEKTGKPVKTLLLDQSVVAGIGNIYSDEILFASGIRPDRPCSTLTGRETARLADAVPERLAYFTEKNAISFEEYRAGRGRDYRNTPYLNVYGKGGKPCPVCGSLLRRIVLGGRIVVCHCVSRIVCRV